jgi:ElaB/YqjD/DUF883 family membrane-anchored ribosome-binding protein
MLHACRCIISGAAGTGVLLNVSAVALPSHSGTLGACSKNLRADPLDFLTPFIRRHAMPDNMAEAQSSNTGRMSEMTDKAKNMASDYGRQAKEYAQQGYDMAAEKSKQLRDTTQQYIEENPWYAIGIALGVGVLLGLVLRGSNRD